MLDEYKKGAKMSIKDRGNIKWTSLMLVEHRERLEKLKKEDGNEKKPELSDEELRRLDFILKKAFKNDYYVKIIYYKNKNFHHCKGKIRKLRSATREIVLYNGENAIEGEKIKLGLENVVNIKLI